MQDYLHSQVDMLLLNANCKTHAKVSKYILIENERSLISPSHLNFFFPLQKCQLSFRISVFLKKKNKGFIFTKETYLQYSLQQS